MSSFTNSDRYFENPYTDFNELKHPSLDELIRSNPEWAEYARETSLQCMKNLKPKPKSKYCDSGVYTGNLGLIYMCYRLLESKIIPQYEKQIKDYMINCLNANIEYYNSPSHRANREIAYIVGKGGFYVMACLVSKALKNQSDLRKYSSEYANLAAICETVDFLRQGSDELFVGRAGYLWYKN
jgi:hypothetical protein